MGSLVPETGEMMLMPSEQLWQDLYRDLLTLNRSVWEQKVPRPAIEKWLSNFVDPGTDDGEERLHALYLLSRFIYFGERELRELLKALYRDLFRQPVVSSIRKRLSDTLDQAIIDAEFKSYMASTRFVGIGGPAESGVHLLYRLRQVNVLPQGLFLAQDSILTTDATTGQTMFRDPSVQHYVFVDDFCGSGEQASRYLEALVRSMRQISDSRREQDGVSPNAQTLSISYFSLVATVEGLTTLRDSGIFDIVESVLELDDSYKCFSQQSRCFRNAPAIIDQSVAKYFCQQYGEGLQPGHGLGFRQGQLLLGTCLNVPDNTLPIIWSDSLNPAWEPIFRRFQKQNT